VLSVLVSGKAHSTRSLHCKPSFSLELHNRQGNLLRNLSMSFQDVGRTGQSKRLTHNFNNAVPTHGPSIGALSVGGGDESQFATGDGNFAELSNAILQYQVMICHCRIVPMLMSNLV